MKYKPQICVIHDYVAEIFAATGRGLVTKTIGDISSKYHELQWL
jgi:hypothetical protein